MARPAEAADLALYRPTLDKWMPRAEVRPPTGPMARFNGLLAMRGGGKAIRYLVDEKRHFRHLDAAVVAEQLKHRRAACLAPMPSIGFSCSHRTSANSRRLS